MTALQTLARRVSGATSYTDIFSSASTDRAATRVAQEYRAYARVLHPDRYLDDKDKQQASDGFVRLGILKAQADAAIARHQAGNGFSPVTITTRRRRYRLDSPMKVGDVCAAYRGVVDNVGAKPVFCKLVKVPADSDLLQNEATALKRLHSDAAETKWKRHVPQLVESFVYDDDGIRRQVNVLTFLEGFYTLEAVGRAFPAGVHPLHAVWMFRRLLMTLGFAHDNHIVHGAIVPEHVMILPEHHGLMVVDWCYASVGIAGQSQPTIKAVVTRYRQWYPEEVLAKQAPNAATDIAMAVRCIIQLMGGNPVTGELPLAVPKPLRAYLKGCLQTKQSMRPQNAWLLLEEFDELLGTMGTPYYPRRFIPFVMPSGIA